MPDYIADDYAFIAKKLKELTSGNRRYGIWYSLDNCWCRMSGTTVRKCASSDTPTLFSSMDEAYKALEGTSSGRNIEVREYKEG